MYHLILSSIALCIHQRQKGFIEQGDYRRCHLRFSSKNPFAATCQIGAGKSDSLYVCQPTTAFAPRLKFDNFMGLSGWITKSRYSHIEAIKGIPTKFISGTLKHLAESWKAYKDKKRSNFHIPKFKSKLRGDKITSLYCVQPKEITIFEYSVKTPGVKLLGKLKVVNQNLKKRWDYTKSARTLQILKKPSGYY